MWKLHDVIFDLYLNLVATFCSNENVLVKVAKGEFKGLLTKLCCQKGMVALLDIQFINFRLIER